MANVAYSHMYAVIVRTAQMAQALPQFAINERVQKLSFSPPWMMGFLKQTGLSKRRDSATQKVLPPPEVVREPIADMQEKIKLWVGMMHLRLSTQMKQASASKEDDGCDTSNGSCCPRKAAIRRDRVANLFTPTSRHGRSNALTAGKTCSRTPNGAFLTNKAQVSRVCSIFARPASSSLHLLLC